MNIYDHLKAAILGEEYSRPLYERAATAMRMGSGQSPFDKNVQLNIPSSMKEWRKNPDWSLKLVDTHLEAEYAAHCLYWQKMEEFTKEREAPGRFRKD